MRADIFYTDFKKTQELIFKIENLQKNKCHIPQLLTE